MIRKIIISLFFSLVWALIPFARGSGQLYAAQEYTAATVPNVQLLDARRFVSNPDGILSSETTDAIDRLCADMRSRGLAEVAVVVVEAVEAASLDNFAFDILNRWGVGRKGANNGLVITVVRSVRDIQFQTGYGLEGVLPDALCKRIQTLYMVPPLREGDWDRGVMEGVRAVYNVLTDNTEELTALRAEEGDIGSARTSFITMLVFLGIFILFIVLSLLGGKRGGGRGGDGGGGGGAMIGALLGMLLGGMGRGGGGYGGGYGGGGFGGGMSGGGGSRTRF